MTALIKNITQTENDGRQWFNVEFNDADETIYGDSSEFGLCEDGTVVDNEGFPLCESESWVSDMIIQSILSHVK